MQTIGQSWLVLELSKSGTALGLVTALQTLPVLVFGPFGGVITDRFPKRKILYATQAASGILALVLGLLVLTKTIQLWMLYPLAVALGFVNAVDNPTRQTFVLEMVGKDQLTNAVSLNSTEINIARAVGPAFAAALTAWVGLAWCFIINAGSYVAVLIGLAMMEPEHLYPAPLVKARRGQLQEGLRYVWRTAVVRNTLLMMLIIGTLTYEFTVSLPLFARFSLHDGINGYGALNTAMGIGAVVGGIFAASRTQTGPKLITMAALFFGVTVLVAATAPNLATALIALLFVGFMSITFTSLGNITLQLETDPEMRGRVMALWTVAFLGSTPIGGPVVGWIGEYAGPRWALAVGGFAALAAAGLGAWTLRKGSRLDIVPSPEVAEAEMAAEEDTRTT